MKANGFSHLNKIILLSALYFTQGVPFGFFTQAFPTVMRQQGYALETISLASLLALPWAAKFLWSPAVDRYKFERIGRRKSWLLPLQLLTGLILFAVGLLPQSAYLLPTLVMVFVVNLLIATQDIASDGLAVDILVENERGIANGIQVAGYRLGMIVGGGILLIIYDNFGWEITFSAMAALVIIASIPVVLHREKTSKAEVLSYRPSIRASMNRMGFNVFALIMMYKFGEAFATGMLRPFLVDSGYSLSDIGWLLGTAGFAAILLGGLIGGALVNTFGRKKSLVLFAVFQAVTVASYVYLATQPNSWFAVVSLLVLEHFVGGMANAALFTCMMDWCSKESSATDYTVQASAVVIAGGIATTLSGFSAGYFGYADHFLLSAFFAFCAVFVVIKVFPEKNSAYGA
jgi:MFS transporter, PAT family, beta-lactamase induction signal transducer AmpG